jgi:hypothetical protein
MKIGFTGNQNGMSKAQRVAFAETIISWDSKQFPTEFHHGDCIGSDEQAHFIVKEVCPHWRIIVHPPINHTKRAFVLGDESRILRDYLPRNRDIVSEALRMIATPAQYLEQLRSGTWYTIRYSRKRGRMIRIIFPDGSFRDENG